MSQHRKPYPPNTYVRLSEEEEKHESGDNHCHSLYGWPRSQVHVFPLEQGSYTEPN